MKTLPEHWREICATVSIMALAVIAYAPALHGGWIWDDYMYIARNPALRSLSGLRGIWTHPEGVNYFPVTGSVQWIQWHLWQDATLGYHATNLALHVLNCLLLCAVLKRLAGTAAGLAGWTAAILFAVHPLACESVAWISELNNVLSLAFLLACLLAYLSPSRSRGHYALSVVLFLLAMLSKSTVAMFPAVLLLLACWQRGKIRRVDVRAALPFAVVSWGLGVLSIWFEHHRAMATVGASAEGFGTRLAGAGLALAFYLLKAVAPFGLGPGYPQWPIHQASVYPFLPWAGVAGVLWWLSRAPPGGWRSHAFFGLGYFCLNLLPILGLIPMAYLRIARVADHFAYAALPGLLALVGAGVARLASKPRAAQWVVAGLACLAGLLTVAIRRNASAYADEETYWSAILHANPASWLAQNALGVARFRSGRIDDATADFEGALRAKPEYVEAHNNLGLAYERLGRPFAAVAQYDRALSLRPDYPEARANLAGLHFRIGLALGRSGRPNDSIAHYQAAVRLKPDYPDALVNLGNALARLGRLSDAIAEYEAALRIAPGYPPALENLRYVRASGEVQGRR